MSEARNRLAKLRADIKTDPLGAHRDLIGVQALLEEAAKAGGVERDDWLELASCFYDLSEFTGAADIMERVLRSYGEDPLLSLKILDALGRCGDPNDLAKLPQRLLALLPRLSDDKDTVRMVAQLSRSVDERISEQYEDRWIALDPDNPRAWLDVAQRAIDMAQFNWPKGFRPSGYAAAKMKRGRSHLDGARRSLVGAHATEAGVWYHLYLLQVRADLLPQAAQSVATFYRLDPQNRDGMLQVLKLIPKFPNIVPPGEIDQILARLLAREWEKAPYWRDLAILAAGTGRRDEGQIALKRCLALAPDDQFTQKLLRGLELASRNGTRTVPQEINAAAAETLSKGWWRWPFKRPGDRQ